MPEPKEASTDGMIREGSQQGPATVRYDPKQHANFHLDGNGERVYHQKPPGFRFNADGTLIAVGADEGEAPVKLPLDPHAGVPAEQEK